ncbi:hypothetical protein SPRG_14000 [Saprolegnia parasitica CBS 223.65]|uniref:Uncharacterized protein n=1 Tax=Saprolegnia parasitica (strain CBS 223.65) TaxID=695850 RepID=A0A067C0X8_SAPPC|nr:hypothetical protein SPRG_14000 [Saprolegnia parasitica CBS 223.65]KDO20482.1 hypothetical protein SPRG_14000 [Saprolegnia parasitica CBS 223.65]|eukprot:XP_012208809.1 hypothetical protein SPRG_14000 [Saprolegnia parasitica CBS 223.65]
MAAASEDLSLARRIDNATLADVARMLPRLEDVAALMHAWPPSELPPALTALNELSEAMDCIGHWPSLHCYAVPKASFDLGVAALPVYVHANIDQLPVERRLYVALPPTISISEIVCVRHGEVRAHHKRPHSQAHVEDTDAHIHDCICPNVRKAMVVNLRNMVVADMCMAHDMCMAAVMHAHKSVHNGSKHRSLASCACTATATTTASLAEAIATSRGLGSLFLE